MQPVAASSIPSVQLREDLIALRQRLHQYPEVGFEEFETSLTLQGWLKDRGFEIHGPLATTGFYVEVEGAHPGPLLAYRADIDALPIQDLKQVPYASKRPGVAHLCGHDAHAAVACGVAVRLRERADELAGTVRVFFQPNEESLPSGAPVMIEAGVLEGVEAVYGMHVDPTLPLGQFGLREGAITAACSQFQIAVDSGQGGHSARPHETVDTVWLAANILNQLYQLTGRIHDARRAAVLTVCQMHGGEAFNVIPARVEFGGTLRCVDLEAFHLLQRQIRRIAKAEGTLFEAVVDVEFSPEIPPVVNDPACIQIASEAIERLRGEDAVRRLAEPSMGGEDFAFYLQERPGAFVRVGSAEGPETRFPLHHARFDIAEGVLPLATQTMTEILLHHARTAPSESPL